MNESAGLRTVHVCYPWTAGVEPGLRSTISVNEGQQKEEEMEQYRQGDVMAVRVDILPKNAKRVKCNGVVTLALGEVTGHSHTVTHPDVEEFEMGGMRFFVIPEPCELRHQEHDAITLPPGTYRVVRQREYTPEAIRNVAD